MATGGASASILISGPRNLDGFGPGRGLQAAAPPPYIPRCRRDEPLARLVRDNLMEFAQTLRDPFDRRPKPRPFVVEALEKFSECGVPRFGVVRYRCPECGYDVFLPFSCKRRGFCPWCDAKRAAIIMSDASARLLPPVPVRQWVLVVPKRLRWYLNRRPELPGLLSKIFAAEISRFITRRAGAAPAQMHFIQRFGGALNLHIHVHALVTDGGFIPADGGKGLAFVPAPPPSPEELGEMSAAVRKKSLRRFLRMGAVQEEAATMLLSWQNGFSIHSEVAVRGEDREGLERLVYYCARPALSPARLEYSEKAGIVIYRTEKREGYPPMLVMSPVEFLRRWGLLMPPAHRNMVHYYGALAPRSPLRKLLVATTEKAAAELSRKKKVSAVKEGMLKKARSWAACLARIFEIYPLICPNCKIELKPVAVILADKELVRLLSHLGLPDELPKMKPAPKAVGPPDEGSQLDPGADLYDNISPPSPED